MAVIEIPAELIITADQKAAEARATLVSSVDTETNRRIWAGFQFRGQTIQTRPSPNDDMLKITGKVVDALAAITVGGAQPDDLMWDGTGQPFGWISLSNEIIPLDAPGMIELGKAAAAHVQFCQFRGRQIKDRILNGEDLDPTDDSLWTPTE